MASTLVNAFVINGVWDRLPPKIKRIVTEIPPQYDNRIIEENGIDNPTGLLEGVMGLRNQPVQKTISKNPWTDALFQNIRKAASATGKALKDRIKEAKSERGNDSQKGSEQVRNFLTGRAKQILIGSLVVVLIVLTAIYLPQIKQLTTSVPEAPIQKVEVAPIVNLTPIDAKSVSFIGPTLIMMIIALVSLGSLGILDGKERLQTSDITVGIVGFCLNYIAVWKPFVAFWTTLFPVFNEQTMAATFGFLITGIVVTKALTGGRDTTNLGVYFGMLAITGAISQQLGAFQVAFNVQSQPVYLLQDLPIAIMAKQMSEVLYSLLVYFLLFLAVASYLLDIFFPKEKKIRWGGIVTTVATVGFFYIAGTKFEVQYALLLGITAGVVLAVLTRKTVNKVSLGENPLAQIVQRVFDYTAWDGVSLGVALMVLLHLMNFA